MNFTVPLSNLIWYLQLSSFLLSSYYQYIANTITKNAVVVIAFVVVTCQSICSIFCVSSFHPYNLIIRVLFRKITIKYISMEKSSINSNTSIVFLTWMRWSWNIKMCIIDIDNFRKISRAHLQYYILRTEQRVWILK